MHKGSLIISEIFTTVISRPGEVLCLDMVISKVFVWL